MADLDPLIRYRKHGVDEKQRVLARLYDISEQLEAEKQALIDQMEKEKALAEDSDSPDVAAFLGSYLTNARKKVAVIDGKRRKLEAEIAVAQEDMRNAFAEMKKVEITQRKRDERDRAEEQAKEDRDLDEIALEGYRRQLDED